MVLTTLETKADLGLSQEQTDDAVKILSTTLADEFLLRTKLRKYHWNVMGPQFRSLHELFEEQYNALATYIDEVAERLRSYGAIAPGTMQEFIELARLEENPDETPGTHQMVANLVKDHEAMVRYMREDIKTAADDIEDVGLEDFLTGQLQEHQEMAWMLRSFLEGTGI